MNALTHHATTSMDPASDADVGTRGEHWVAVCAINEIPRLGSRVVRSAKGNIAVFRTADDEVFALDDRCPHKGGPLSQGIVHGRHVTCPLHGWNLHLVDGHAVAPDDGVAARYPLKIDGGVVYIKL